jgi:antitoxin component of MazEF toxin-antitoxin module
MSDVFEAKLRKVGNSLGIIIPNEMVRELGFGDGDTIQVAIPSTNTKSRNRKLMALVGVEKDTGPFKRDKGDRF